MRYKYSVPVASRVTSRAKAKAIKDNLELFTPDWDASYPGLEDTIKGRVSVTARPSQPGASLR